MYFFIVLIVGVLFCWYASQVITRWLGSYMDIYLEAWQWQRIRRRIIDRDGLWRVYKQELKISQLDYTPLMQFYAFAHYYYTQRRWMSHLAHLYCCLSLKRYSYRASEFAGYGTFTVPTPDNIYSFYPEGQPQLHIIQGGKEESDSIIVPINRSNRTQITNFPKPVS